LFHFSIKSLSLINISIRSDITQRKQAEEEDFNPPTIFHNCMADADGRYSGIINAGLITRHNIEDMKG
jgi:hypothetical protein